MEKLFLNNKKIYTIGTTRYKKEGEIEGLYIFGMYGLPLILTNLEKAKEKDIFVLFDDYLEAQKYVQYLARCYRYEFRQNIKYQKDIKTGRFYVKKLGKEEIEFFKNNTFNYFPRSYNRKQKETKDGCLTKNENIHYFRML